VDISDPLDGGWTANRLGMFGSVGTASGSRVRSGGLLNLVEYLRFTRSAVLSSRDLSRGRGVTMEGAGLFVVPLVDGREGRSTVLAVAEAGALMRVGALILSFPVRF